MYDQAQLEMIASVDGFHAELHGPTGSERVSADSYADIRKLIVQRALTLARQENTEVRLVIDDPSQDGVRLIATPGGSLQQDNESTVLRSAIAVHQTPASPPAAALTPLPSTLEKKPAHLAPIAILPARAQSIESGSRLDRAAEEGSEGEPAAPEPEPVQSRRSFIADVPVEPPATAGFAGLLTRMGIGVKPSTAELAHRANVRMVSQHWPGPRTIAVANGRGGVGKTMTAAAMAAVLARFGGGGVLAWDNNDTRGTLGWRTEKGAHDATLRDLLANAERLLGPSCSDADFAAYIHHQPADMFDVLRSNPELLARYQYLSEEDFDTLHRVAVRFRRIVLFDSGNDESTPRWLRMIDHSDQLVVPMRAHPEHAESGALLLEALLERDERSARLAQNAVVIVSQNETDRGQQKVQDIAAGFNGFARTVVTVPYDPALHSGHIHFAALRPASQRAWITATAAVAGGL